MEIRFNVIGTKRKALVTAVSEIVGGAPVYKGAPTFAYAVSNYIIDKKGTLTGAITQELLDALAERGFPHSESGTAFNLTEATTEPTEIYVPELAQCRNTDVDYNEAFPIGAAQVETSEMLTIELPKDGFTELAIANLEKLVESKAALIKKAIGQNLAQSADGLPIEQTEGTLRFPWFRFGLSSEEVNAYSHFIGALCAMAKEQKRVTATAKEVDNEKYAFRCFLLRLGFIGEDYKAKRKILLSNLFGNGSFKSGERRPVPEERAFEETQESAETHSEDNGEAL